MPSVHLLHVCLHCSMFCSLISLVSVSVSISLGHVMPNPVICAAADKQGGEDEKAVQ